MHGRTTILISHRVSTVRNADRIFVLEHGEIVEQGTHAELLGNGGYYADLYQKQLLEEELRSDLSSLRVNYNVAVGIGALRQDTL